MVFDSRMEGFLGANVPWHWHEYAELMVVREGCVTVAVPGQQVTLRAGQGCFFNGSALHRAAAADESPCRASVVIFDPMLVSGGEGELFERYVRPLLYCRQLVLMPLTGQEDWHQSVLDGIGAAAEIYDRRDFSWEFLLRRTLTDVWLTLLRGAGDQLGRSGRGIREQRLRSILRYFQEHLGGTLHLEEASAAAGLSTRECTRCFRELLNLSPIEYLTELRVRAAALELEQSVLPLAQVGGNAGFSSSSYFGKVFRQYTGCTPRAYRKMARRAEEKDA